MLKKGISLLCSDKVSGTEIAQVEEQGASTKGFNCSAYGFSIVPDGSMKTEIRSSCYLSVDMQIM